MAESAATVDDLKGAQTPTPAPEDQKSQAVKGESVWKDVWYSLSHNALAMVSLVYIALLVLIALVTLAFPAVLPHDPYEQDLSLSFAAPSAEHWFGCDQQGRDIFTRILVGTQISLSVGIISVAISLTVGVLLGAIAGYKGGKTDTIIMRCMDIIYAYLDPRIKYSGQEEG